MDDDQVIRLTDEKTGKRKSGSNLVIAGFLLLIVLMLAYGAYYLGRNSGSASTSTLSPTPLPFPTESLLSPGLSPTVSVIPSGTITPTKSLTNSPTPIEKTKILSSVAGLDGFRSSNNGGNNALDIRAGRNSNLVTRGFVTFAVTGIPTNAQIKSATVRLYQSKVIGDPYSAGGALKIDHLTYGNTLDSTDYGLPALTSNIQTLSNNKTLEWKDADVTSEFKNDIANSRSNSQYRIHFTTEVSGGDSSGDFTYFDSANSYSENSGHSPQLIVKYY